MKNKSIAIIGGGNLGASIAEGIASSGLISPENICVTRRKIENIEYLTKQNIQIDSDNKRAVQNADIILLAVKPKQIRAILEEIKPVLNEETQILISVITGVSLSNMESIVGSKISIFRAMPNTAVAIRESMTCIATNNATTEQKEEVVEIFNTLGKAVIIDENLMAASTVLGACGIAYALRYIRAQSQGGIEIGFNAEVAQLIAAQTVKGAASLLLERGQHPEREIDKVTTPQGCTIAGLNEMEHQGFSSALIKGIITSFNKIDVIADDF
ncbi:MAG: pyrroline-5-carboxylate reductase [Thalassobius sp.]|nr:pyrroline-5-carboxylate reductase [Thalassovita sp.]